MESSHHQGQSGDTGEPGRRSRYSRDILTLTLEYRAWPGRLTRAHSRLCAVWNIKYERNIFSFFCCEWNHKPSCRHTRTHFT